MVDSARGFNLTRIWHLGSLIARLKKILKLSSPHRVQLERLREVLRTASTRDFLLPGGFLAVVWIECLLLLTRGGPPSGGMSSTAQFESVRKQYFLVTTYYTMTKRILLLAAVLGVGLLAQPSIYAQEKKAKATPSPAAATTEAKTPAKKAATKTTHHAKKAAKKEASPKAQ
jgi:hypothetical protein